MGADFRGELEIPDSGAAIRGVDLCWGQPCAPTWREAVGVEFPPPLFDLVHARPRLVEDVATHGTRTGGVEGLQRRRITAKVVPASFPRQVPTHTIGGATTDSVWILQDLLLGLLVGIKGYNRRPFGGQTALTHRGPL